MDAAVLENVWEHIQAGIIIIDADSHRILAANPMAEEMTGFSEDEMVSKTCHRLICPAHAGKCPITDLGLSLERSERVLLHRNGTPVPVLKTVTAVTVGNKKYLIENYVDISSLKDAEDALIAYIREATLRIRGPLELVRNNLFHLRKQAEDGDLSTPSGATTLAAQERHLEAILHNLAELEHAIAEKRREIPDALREYLKR